MFELLTALFGNETAAKVILYIVNYDEGHLSGIAATFGVSKQTIYQQIRRLEDGGIIVGRSIGNMKMFTINPRCPIKKQIMALAEQSLSLMSDEEAQAYFRQRRRPRRTGKEL